MRKPITFSLPLYAGDDVQSVGKLMAIACRELVRAKGFCKPQVTMTLFKRSMRAHLVETEQPH